MTWPRIVQNLVTSIIRFICDLATNSTKSGHSIPAACHCSDRDETELAFDLFLRQSLWTLDRFTSAIAAFIWEWPDLVIFVTRSGWISGHKNAKSGHTLPDPLSRFRFSRSSYDFPFRRLRIPARFHSQNPEKKDDFRVTADLVKFVKKNLITHLHSDQILYKCFWN